MGGVPEEELGAAFLQAGRTTAGNIRGGFGATGGNIGSILEGIGAASRAIGGAAKEAISPTPEEPEPPPAPPRPLLRSVTPVSRRRRRRGDFDLFGTLLAGKSNQGALATPPASQPKGTLG